MIDESLIVLLLLLPSVEYSDDDCCLYRCGDNQDFVTGWFCCEYLRKQLLVPKRLTKDDDER